VVEGPFGLDNLLRMRLRVDWDHEGYEGVTTSTIKKYNAQIHTQSAIECILQLVAANTPRLDVAAGFDPGTIASIQAEVPQITYDFTGGGLYGLEKDVRTKEQADHDLRYLLAVAFLDRDVLPAQFAADRITRPDVQSLMTKVSARPNAAYTARYPQQMPAKITVRLKDGTTFSHEVQDYPGMPSHPFTWDDVTGKFDRLVAGRVDTDLATQIKDAVRSVENIQVKDLMTLLARVRAD
jgi:2-methylcitrate dehydratase